jgi:hypothetical protein
MKLTIKHQEHYSRLQLLLRLFFGWLYIGIPHFFLLYFLSLWAFILMIIAFFAVLFTGRYPEGMYKYQVGLALWSLRVNSRIYNVSDGYPAFGMNATDENVVLEMPRPEKLSRGLLLLRLFFGWLYVMIPHGFLLFFRGLATMVIMLISWFIVLFTGKYPASFHAFVVGLMRWNMRVNFYIMFMTDTYPPFTGKEIE